MGKQLNFAKLHYLQNEVNNSVLILSQWATVTIRWDTAPETKEALDKYELK